MENFETKLKRLEYLGEQIRQSDVSLEDAFKCFEEGSKLACELEKEIDRIEGKIQILTNEPNAASPDAKPALDLFSDFDA
jgi:exodeoxyribonuclease VII small subunit